MIVKLSKLIYIFIVILVILVFIINFLEEKIFLDSRLVYLFIILLFPFFDILFESLKKDISKSDLTIMYQNNIWKYTGLIIFAFGLYTSSVDIKNILILCFIVFSFVFSIDSRISFVGALFLLILTPIYLIIGDKAFAEILSIYAYYFLIIGVSLEIKQQIFPERKISENSVVQNTSSSIDKNSGKIPSFLSEIFELGVELLGIIKYKILNIKNKILEDIGEQPSKIHPSPISVKKDNILQKIGTKSKATISHLQSSQIHQNFYVKLILYFGKKINENIQSLTLFIFTFSSFTAMSLLYYTNLENIITYSFGLFFVSYLYSKYLSTLYDFTVIQSHNIKSFTQNRLLSRNVTIGEVILHEQDLSENEVDNISNARSSDFISDNKKTNAYFINKASIFASFGLIAGYILIVYLKIGEVSSSIYIAIFILFFLVYYLLFSDLSSRLIGRTEKTGKYVGQKIQNISITSFMKKHVYLFLNGALIFSIVIVLGIQNNIFSDLYLNYQEKNSSQISIPIVEKKIELTREQKNLKAIELTKQLALISGEVTIKSLSGSIEPEDSLVQTGSINEPNKISVKKYYTFKQSLSLGSKTLEVVKLEEILKKLKYFTATPDKIFDEQTKQSLTNLLKKECDWPESTKGILGNQAMQCLYSLEITK